MPREGSGSLSILPVCYTPWCSTDAVAVVTDEASAIVN